MLSQELIQELKDTIEKEYSIELSKDEATKTASELLRFFELLTKQDYENHKKGQGL